MQGPRCVFFCGKSCDRTTGPPACPFHGPSKVIQDHNPEHRQGRGSRHRFVTRSGASLHAERCNVNRVGGLELRRCPYPAASRKTACVIGKQVRLRLLIKLLVGRGERRVAGFQRTNQGFHQHEIAADDIDGFPFAACQGPGGAANKQDASPRCRSRRSRQGHQGRRTARSALPRVFLLTARNARTPPGWECSRARRRDPGIPVPKQRGAGLPGTRTMTSTVATDG